MKKNKLTNQQLIQLLTILNNQPINLLIIKPNELLKLAKHHRITSLIYRALQNYPNAPQVLLGIFKTQTRENQGHALKQFHSAVQLANLFQKNDIPVMFFKGLILSHQLYGDISMRQSVDIDILIPQDRLLEIDNLLQKNGYKRYYPKEWDPNYLKQTLTTYKDFSYFTPNKNQVEVHWRLVGNNYSFRTTFENLWQERRKVSIMNYDFYTLSNEDEWLYLCNHSMVHACRRLQWLTDLTYYKLTQPQLCENILQKKIKKYESLRQQGLALDLIKNIFPNIVSADPSDIKSNAFLYNTVLAEMQGLDLLSNSPDKLHYYQMQLLDSLKSKIYYLSYIARQKMLNVWMKKKRPVSLFFLSYFHYAVYGSLRLFRMAMLKLTKKFNHAN